ncbi:MAG: hypothetical protein QOF28_2060 [Actinomycetota bacterium]|nr:hypothetical protein [Actinomycetota bacterium]
MEQLRDVSNILWRERNLLELLAFKLDAERLLARAGRTRWLARADHEVELVLGELKAVELERGIQVQALGVELGLEADATLLLLAESAPDEWSGILSDHRRALLDLARDVDRSARRSRRKAPTSPVATAAEGDDRGAAAVSRAIADIVQPACEDVRPNRRASARSSATSRQRAIGRPDAVVARLPSLVDFLR